MYPHCASYRIRTRVFSVLGTAAIDHSAKEASVSIRSTQADKSLLSSSFLREVGPVPLISPTASSWTTFHHSRLQSMLFYLPSRVLWKLNGQFPTYQVCVSTSRHLHTDIWDIGFSIHFYAQSGIERQRVLLEHNHRLYQEICLWERTTVFSTLQTLSKFSRTLPAICRSASLHNTRSRDNLCDLV